MADTTPFLLDEWVGACAAACEPADEAASMARLRVIFDSTKTDAVRAAIPNEGADEVLLHEDERCTVYIVRVPPNIEYPAHDHGMATLVLCFEGIEVNKYYKHCAGAPLELTGRAVLRPGDCEELPVDVIHAISSEGDTRSQALHVYLGDLGAETRCLYDVGSGASFPFTEAKYFELARPRA